MLKKLSYKLTTRLLCKGVIEYDDFEIYQYGLEQIFTNIINVLTLIVMGVIFDNLVCGLIFAAAFMELRAYAGGYHASTPVRCYILTTVVIIVVLLLMKYVEVSYFFELGLIVISGFVIILLSPVESVNKPLDDIERKVYRKKAILIWCVEIVIAIWCVFLKFNEVAISIVMAHVVLGASQLAGLK